MERRQSNGILKAQTLIGLLLLSSFTVRIVSLSVTVNDVECVYDYVLYEGDTISGNFVVVDHDIFWSSDHPGIDFTVISSFIIPNCILFHCIFLKKFRFLFWFVIWGDWALCYWYCSYFLYLDLLEILFPIDVRPKIKF